MKLLQFWEDLNAWNRVGLAAVAAIVLILLILYVL